MPEATITKDKVYTATTGTTAYINGERGTVTGVTYNGGRRTGAFINLDERPAMLYATFSQAKADVLDDWRVVLSSKEITRAQFDSLMGIPDLRADLGWREQKVTGEDREVAARTWDEVADYAMSLGLLGTYAESYIRDHNPYRATPEGNKE